MSTGQGVGAVIGAAIGYALAPVTGGASLLIMAALQGAAVGAAVGGALDPPKGPTVEGPRLNDLSVQTSTYSQFIPRTYGTIGLSGNVFWLENNKLKEVVKKKKSGGKGGGSSSTVKTYTYFATFAVGLCEGPIGGVRRIWVGPDLVYDAGSDDLETIISSNQSAGKFTIYLGTDTQQPDPRMQAEMGVANCPAFRGLAYVVVKDLKLTNYGNSVAGAQVKVEVVNSLAATVPAYVKDLPMSGTPCWSGDGNIQTAEVLPESFGPEGYIGKIRFRLYSESTGELILTEEKTGTIPLGAGSTNPLYYETIAVIGKKSSGFCCRTIVGAIKFFDSSIVTEIAENLTTSGGQQERAYAGGYYWIGAGPKIYKFNADFAFAGSFTVDGETNAIRWRIRYDESTGRFFSKNSKSSDNSISLWEFSTDPSVKIWEQSLGVAAGSDGDVSDFVASGGRISVGIDSSVKVYSIGASGMTLAGVSATYGAPRKSVHYASDPVVFSADRLYQTTARAVESEVPLSTIVAVEAARSSLIKPADVDAAGLIDAVTGFKVTATGSIRNAIEPLRGAWPFDVVQSGYKIKATSRGSASVVTIPIGELAIDTQLTESREMDSQLPQNVTVKYIDRDRDYDQNEQRAQRDNTEAVNSLVIDLPVVLDANQSAQVADKLIRIYALEKSDFAFTLPAPYRYLEPGDVVTIAAADASYVLRLVSVNHTADGRLECAGRPSNAATYTSIAPGDGGQEGAATIPLAGATVGILIDCPVIDETLQDAPGFALGMDGYSAGWPGGVLFRTADGGQTWDDLQAIQGRATAGFASTVLAANAGNLIQRGGTLTVSLISGTLESVTESQMLNGANICAYGINGRWEVMRFQNATLNGDGTYTLDTFWRGDKGTEWATGMHAANDYFMLMTDPDLAFVGMPTDSIGQPREYRFITSGADIDSAASAAFTYAAFTYAGVNLETLSGVLPVGRRSAGDLTVTWQRRTRVGGAWRDNVDASLGESVEAYEVDIMQGATVRRTITASTPSVLYTSAQQVTDFGSAQASVVVNIYQLSSVVGRGYPLGATL
jgi:hypothetical protein